MVYVSFPTFSISGDFARDSLIFAHDLDQMGYNIRSFRVPLERSVRQVMIPSFRKNFESEGRPSWPPLSSATIANRLITGYPPGPILNRTGKLKRAATTLSIWQFDRTSAAVTGLDQRVSYAGYHQGGTSKMPQRSFIEIQDEDAREIEIIFWEWLQERIARYVARRGL